MDVGGGADVAVASGMNVGVGEGGVDDVEQPTKANKEIKVNAYNNLGFTVTPFWEFATGYVFATKFVKIRAFVAKNHPCLVTCKSVRY